MTADMWRSNKYYKCVYDTIEDASDDLRTLSLKIHDNPETGLKEFKSHAWLTEYLASKGFTVEQGKSGLQTAFIARAGDKSGGYDALPGIGHACGHNLIAISGIATALAIKAVIEKFNLPAQIKLFGTPSEEHDAGKITMLDAGDFEGVDVCMMLHGAPSDIIYTPFLSLNVAIVEYFGKASHASTTPWEGINALDAAMEVYTNIGLMRQQIRPDCRVHGIIENGGQAANIIPEYTRSIYIARAPKTSQVEELMIKFEKVFKAAADSTGCKLKITWRHLIKDILTNGQLSGKFEQVMNSFGVKYAPKEEQRSKLSGSTDMGNLTYAMPGIHPMFNILNLKGVDDMRVGLHTKEFEAAAALPTAHVATLRASKALAMTGIECIIDPKFLQRVKEEFKQSV
ncbi:hypothetical protein BX616_011093 [Lobosporangium transversale]|nr:hypothetical protein BX616_011093 [Lobosporangium transversale]